MIKIIQKIAGGYLCSDIWGNLKVINAEAMVDLVYKGIVVNATIGMRNGKPVLRVSSTNHKQIKAK